MVGHHDGRHCLLQQGEIVFEGDRIVFVGHGFSGEVDEQRRLRQGADRARASSISTRWRDLDTTILGFDNQPAWRKGAGLAAQLHGARPPYEMYYARRNSLPEALRLRAIAAQRHHHGAADRVAVLSRMGRDRRRVRAPRPTSPAELGCGSISARPIAAATWWSMRPATIGAYFDEARGLRGTGGRPSPSAAHTRARHGGLVRTMLAPDRIETCTPELLRRTAARGARAGRAGSAALLPVAASKYDMVLARLRHEPAGVAGHPGLPVAALAAAARHLGLRLARHAAAGS